MQDDKTELPEGTDKIIAGASDARPSHRRRPDGDVLLVADVGDEPIAATASHDRQRRAATRSSTRSAPAARSCRARRPTRPAGWSARASSASAEALANVGKLVGDTADGLDERLGPEYGDYARRAATAIEDAANSIASKDADELIDDTREFVRKSPGVALAGAAIVGFALARLIKTGLAEDDDERGGRRIARELMLKPADPADAARAGRRAPDRRAGPPAGRGGQGLRPGRARRRQGDRRGQGRALQGPGDPARRGVPARSRRRSTVLAVAVFLGLLPLMGPLARRAASPS